MWIERATRISGGPLDGLLDDPSIESIRIDGPDAVFVERGGVADRTDVRLRRSDIAALVERLTVASGRRFDRTATSIDASVPGEWRLHAVGPLVTRSSWVAQLRRTRRGLATLAELQAEGALRDDDAARLRAAVAGRANLLVVGPPRAGATTLLGALLAEVPAGERVVLVEDVLELPRGDGDRVALERRSDGDREAHSIRRLIDEACRLEPERLVVGRLPGEASLEFLAAIDDGVAGMAAMRAADAVDALRKLATAPLLAGRVADARMLARTVASTIDLVAVVGFAADGRRGLASLVAPTGRLDPDGIPEVVPAAPVGVLGR